VTLAVRATRSPCADDSGHQGTGVELSGQIAEAAVRLQNAGQITSKRCITMHYIDAMMWRCGPP
jgi:hypothetical protein